MLLFTVIAVSAMFIQCSRNNPVELKPGSRMIRDLSGLPEDDHDDSYDDGSDINSLHLDMSESEADYEASKLKSKALYEKMKSMMHYDPGNDEKMNGYTFVHDYQIDDDDIRTLSQNTYDEWPIFFHVPLYAGHSLNDKLNAEKAKDKRYVTDKSIDSTTDATTDTRESIPVHEEIEDDVPFEQKPHLLASQRYTRGMISDNPFEGEQPFLSFVLSDIDRNDKDALHFKGINWDSAIDREPTFEHYPKRQAHSAHIKDVINDKGQDNRREFDRRERAHKDRSKHHSDYNKTGNHYKGHKDISDTFSNRHAKHDIGKDSQFELKKSQDKANKKNGFHKVYHKDEYMLNDEFYDNTKQTANAHERGHAQKHKGGSDAVVHSHAAADIGEDADAYHNHGYEDREKLDRGHRGHNAYRDRNRDYTQLRDLAKKISASNIGDYVDHYK